MTLAGRRAYKVLSCRTKRSGAILLSLLPVASVCYLIWNFTILDIHLNPVEPFKLYSVRYLSRGFIKGRTTAVKARSNGMFTSPHHSYLERQLMISCSNMKTINANAPESMLQTFCNTIETNYKYNMSWTSTNFSKIYLKSSNVQTHSRILVSIDTFDKRNKRNQVSYDVIVIWCEQTDGDGRVSGNVINFKNGSYLGIVKVFWTGKSSIYVKIVSSVQNTCIRLKSIKKYGTSKYTEEPAILIYGTFKQKYLVETTPCSPSPFVFGYEKVCNLTSLNDGISWFCGHPHRKYLNCSHIQAYRQLAANVKYHQQNEQILYPGHSIFRDVVTLTENSSLRIKMHKNTSCNAISPLESWKDQVPTGYWLNGSWNLVDCYSTLKHTVNEYRHCLKNKTIILLGDSTIRQYASYLKVQVLDLPSHIQKQDTIQNDSFHRYTTYQNYGIKVMYFKHEMPLECGFVTSKGIASIPGIIDSMRKNKDVVNTSIIFVVSYHLHLVSYSQDIFRDRVRRLAVAIQQFLKANPLTKVFFKSPKLTSTKNKDFDARFALLFRVILKEEFTNILQHVTYLDTWDISVAHNSQAVHPEDNAFKSQIHQLMTYIC